MAILSLILFGSRARGDPRPESDTDILGWTDEAYPDHRQHGDVSLALYPGPLLLGLAAAGDLFVAHLALEAVPLHDPQGLLAGLRDAYTPPSDYAETIAAASDLGWFLVDHHSALSATLVNARAAWCARTIAIARTAERGAPAFSPAALAKAVDPRVLPRLISRRNDVGRLPDTSMLMREFLVRHGRPARLDREQASMHDYARVFAKTDNGFAMKTMRQSGLKDEAGAYF